MEQIANPSNGYSMKGRRMQWTILEVDGSIEIHVLIGDHVEAIMLWTMELSMDTDIILGYDWL